MGAQAVALIVAVCKSGGWKNRHMRVEYGPDHVRWLRDQLSANVSVPFRFVCLSDMGIAGVDVLALKDDLPGWWSKLELFREFDRAFYVDLDTVITGDLAPMLRHPHRFSVLRNLSSPNTNRIGSGVMAWGVDASHLYRAFMADPKRHMRECVTSAKWGDQGFIESERRKSGGFSYLQDQFPGAICSYKVDRLSTRKVPASCRIVCFHGEPRPWQVKHEWVPKHEPANCDA